MFFLPESLYGTYAEVKKRSKRLAKRLLNQEPLAEVVDSTRLLDVVQADRPIVIANKLKPQVEAFYPYLLPLEFGGVIHSLSGGYPAWLTAQTWLIEQAIQTDWGTLMVNGDGTVDLFFGLVEETQAGRVPEVLYRFLAATFQHGSAFEALGEVYSPGYEARAFFSTIGPLGLVLFNLGVPTDALDEGMPLAEVQRRLPPALKAKLKAVAE